MCLSKKTDFYKKDYGVGYKVFSKCNGELYSQIIDCYIKRPLKQWLKANYLSVGTEFYPYERYEAGWHIFLNKKDAKQWLACKSNCIRKVKFRKVICSGTQGQAKIIVAKEMLILPKWRIL